MYGSCSLYLPSSLSVSRFSLLSRSLSVLCVESDRLCVPVVLLVLGSGFRSYSSSLKRDVSPLLNSSEILRAVKQMERSCYVKCIYWTGICAHDFKSSIHLYWAIILTRLCSHERKCKVQAWFREVIQWVRPILKCLKHSTTKKYWQLYW